MSNRQVTGTDSGDSALHPTPDRPAAAPKPRWAAPSRIQETPTAEDDLSRTFRWALFPVLAIGAPSPVAIAGLATFASVVTPDYDWVSQTISQLAAPGRPYADMVRAGLLLQAAMSVSIGLGLLQVFGWNGRIRLPVALLGVYAVANLVAAMFDTESQRTLLPGVTEQLIHQRAAHVGILSVLLTMGALAYAVRNRPEWRPFADLSVALAAVAVVVGIPFPTQIWLEIHGVLQRVLLGLTLLWAELVALWLLRTALTRGGLHEDHRDAHLTASRSVPDADHR